MRTLLIVFAVALAGCAQLGDDDLYGPQFTGDGGVTFESVQAIFDESCAVCHSGQNPQGGLSLTAADSVAELFGPDGEGVEATHADCNGLLLVVPEKPDESCLWILVDEGLMPQGSRLPDAQLATIRGWIEAGALLPAAE